MMNNFNSNYSSQQQTKRTGSQNHQRNKQHHPAGLASDLSKQYKSFVEYNDHLNSSHNQSIDNANILRKSLNKSQLQTQANNSQQQSQYPLAQHKQNKIRDIHTLVNGNTKQKCQKIDCKKRTFRRDFCKKHFQNQLLLILRKELRNVYRGPDKAYASMDFTGIGSIQEEDFLNSMIVKKVDISLEEFKDFFFLTNMFKSSNNGNGMNFDSFKKIFFPHLSMIQDGDAESDQERREKQERINMSNNKGKQPEIIQDRLRKLEKLLKERFSNNWDSVRKAFLGLDTDYDGFITVEDILRYFGQDNKEFIFNDLKKLILEKDSSKSGKLGYSDFSKWVGNSIHQSEGFYFRHDSVKNPQFEQNLDNQNVLNEMKKGISTNLQNEGLEKTIIEKIKSQWKTIRKAFIDLNKEKTGFIEAQELRFYFKHWGLDLTDQQFQFIFNKFDCDKDGKISYKDFHKSVGSEIHPGETLYFRQDKPHMMRMNKCQHNKCWQPTQGYGNFCQLHNKMYIDQGIEYFQSMFKKIGSEKWPLFIQDMKDNSEHDDHRQIFFDKFCKIAQKYAVVMSEHQKQLLLDTFPGRNEGEKFRLNISKLYEVRYNDKLKKIYVKIKMSETDDEDVAVDTSGYTGNFHRHVDEKNLKPYSMERLADLIFRNNQLVDIMRAIKDIDKEHNGYVTVTELDDILKISYKAELADKNLKAMFKPYASIQNKILIDYKKFRDYILEKLKLMKKLQSDNENIKKLKLLEIQKKELRDKISQKNQKIRRMSNEIQNEYKEQVQKRQSHNNSTILHNLSIQDTLNDQKNHKESNLNSSYLSIERDRDFKDQTLIKHKLQQLRSKRNIHYATIDNRCNENNDYSLNNSAYMSQRNLKNSEAQSRSLSKRRLNEQTIKTENEGFMGIQIPLRPQTNQSKNIRRGGMYSSQQRLNQSTLENSQINHQERKQSQSPYITLEQMKNNNHADNNNYQKTLQQKKGNNMFQRISSSFVNQNNINAINLNKSMNEGPEQKERGLHNLLNSQYNHSSSRSYQQQQNQLQSATTQNFFKPQSNLHQQIRQKLEYEWKNIYRCLNNSDQKQNRTITRKQFEDALSKTGVFLSNEDVKWLQDNYGDSHKNIQYDVMSQSLGLHQNSFNLMRETQSKINRIKTASQYGGTSTYQNSTMRSMLKK
eukprot:403367915